MRPERAIARLLRDGRPVGLAFSVGARYLVTCAHVVNAALGRPARETSAPPAGASVAVAFAFGGEDGTAGREGTVTGWLPERGGFERHDVAVLRLSQEPPEGTGRLVLASGDPTGEVQMWGPSAHRSTPGHVEGHLMGEVEDDRWQIDQRLRGVFRVRRGFSGGPVWRPETGEVVGVLQAVSIDEEATDAYVIGVDMIAKAWPAGTPGPAWLQRWAQPTPERLRRERAQEMENRFVPATRWFTGRHRALTELSNWLASTDDGDHRARVVTGNPGSGKTAVLGLLAALSDPDWAADIPRDGLPATQPPPSAIDAAIYAGGLTTESVLAGIAGAAEISIAPSADLSDQVSQVLDGLRGRRQPLVVVVDALDEAIDPEDLVSKVLRPLIDDGLGRVRLLLGSRKEPDSRRSSIRLLGPRVVVVDLDSNVYEDPGGVREYAKRVLLQSHTGSPYWSVGDDVLVQVANAVGEAAGTSFLVARIVGQTLSAARQAADPADPDWRSRLPRSASDAVGEDFRTRLGAHEQKVRELLLPLAYAQGSGIPREGGIWPQLANALHPGRTYTVTDVQWLCREAGSYVTESCYAGRSAYRLFHQSLVEYLQEGRDQPSDQAVLTQALIGCVPPASDGRQNWADAHRYIRTHLATHAAQARRLDGLLTDPDYLLIADPTRLCAALDHPESIQDPAVHAAASAYRDAVRRFTYRPRDEHAAYLRLAAQCHRADPLVEQLDRTELGYPWRARWVDWSPQRPARVVTGQLGRPPGVDLVHLDRRPTIVTAAANVILLWDLATGEAVPEVIGENRITATAAGHVDGRPWLVTTDIGGRIITWDLTRRRPVGPSIQVPGGSWKQVLALATVHGRPVVLSPGSAGSDGMIRTYCYRSMKGVSLRLVGTPVSR